MNAKRITKKMAIVIALGFLKDGKTYEATEVLRSYKQMQLIDGYLALKCENCVLVHGLDSVEKYLKGGKK